MTAQPPPAGAARRQLLAFCIADEWFAVEVTRIRSVEPRPVLTPVPGAPKALPGVFAAHGQIVAALDPRVVLRLPPPTQESSGFAIIAAEGELSAGILVDWVDEVVQVAGDAIEPPAAASECSAGQVRLGNRLLSLLDLGALFTAAADG